MALGKGVYLITNAGSSTAATLKDEYIKGWERLQGEESLIQLWYLALVPTSGAHQLYAAFNLATNKCLDLQGGLAAKGTPVLGWDYNKTDNQHWSMMRQSAGEYYKQAPLLSVARTRADFIARIQNVKASTFVDLDNGGKGNGSKIQGWAGQWEEANSHQQWNFELHSARGYQVQAVLDEHPKLHGKIIVEYPDRIYFTPDRYFLEAIWTKSGLADVEPRELIKVDGFDILCGTVSTVEKSTQKIFAYDISLSVDEAGKLTDIIIFDPQSGKTLRDSNSVII
ncbi:ricin B lectin domain-containing protein [Schizophyllum commune]